MSHKPTPDERAAMERVRNSPGTLNVRDQVALANVALREHPADEDEPITPEWLKECGFVAVESDMGRNYADHYEITKHNVGTLNLWRFNDTDEWLINGFDSWPLKTRGNVRNLMSAFEIDRNEPFT